MAQCFPWLLLSSMRSLLAEMNAISKPEKKAERTSVSNTSEIGDINMKYENTTLTLTYLKASQRIASGASSQLSLFAIFVILIKMSTTNQFKTVITEGYTFKGDYILLGGATMNGEPVTDAQIKAPLKTVNRHRLIAGDTIKKPILILTLIIALSFGACKEDEGQTGVLVYEPSYEVLEISTDFGEIYLSLYDETPLHQANFDSLTRAGFYDSTEFHRCVDDFVIQGGSPTSKDDNRFNDGSGGPGYTITAEIDSSKFKHFYGALAAARTGNMTNPERRSSGSQFYIVTDTSGAHFLDGEYTTFGRVLVGMDVAKAIEGQPKNGNDVPNQRIKMYLKYVQLSQAQLDEKGIVLPQ